ncbi:MAG: metallophosphoesterase [Oscillospiraceae bacterium]|nr:metallophosphoesterase [Oscillospiraceae bacterium]
MALYALGDMHLHYGTTIRASMQMKDRVWRNHEEVFRRNCETLIQPEDTLVLVGDNSFGKNPTDCEPDMQYMMGLPGRKILLRGNHDKYWDAKKTNALNERYQGRLNFLQNNFYPYEDFALVGTKGHCFEGPFYLDRKGRILGWDEKNEEKSKEQVEKETGRLIQSFEAAKSAGYRRFLMFLHYPPTNILEEESSFTKLAEEYGVEQVIYAHSHGEARFYDSIQGEFHGIEYSLVSGDYLRWKPKRIL